MVEKLADGNVPALHVPPTSLTPLAPGAEAEHGFVIGLW